MASSPSRRAEVWTRWPVARYRRIMAALLPILIFVIVVAAANRFEFGRID